jgi:pimeloyl-ACP methyl ester carboxylesterase
VTAVGARLDRPDGARIAFDVAGDPRRPALVLLGGIGGDATTWRRDVATFAAELFVVVVDHRGIGRSTASGEDPTITMYVEDVVAVLDEIRVGRAHVYGHSFGAIVAIELALTHADRVRTLILGAARPGRSSMVPTTSRAPLGRPWELLYSTAFLRDHREEVAADRAATARRHDGERLQALAARTWDPGPRLASLAVPVLIVHGSEDRLVPVENAARLADAIPGARRVTLAGAGHAYHAEMPERADDVVLGFIRDHGRDP